MDRFSQDTRIVSAWRVLMRTLIGNTGTMRVFATDEKSAKLEAYKEYNAGEKYDQFKAWPVSARKIGK